MKKTAILLMLLSMVKIGFAQIDIERQMIEKAPNCEDIAFNCTQLIEKYYNSSKMDSVDAVLAYWENKCGLSEPIIRFKILLSIRDNMFTESIYDTNIIDYIVRFSDRIGSKNPMETYMYYKIYFSYVQINGSFDKLTMRIANELLNNQSENSLEFLFCKLYSGYPDYFFDDIQNKNKYNDTKLKEYYFKLVNRSVHLPEFHCSLYSGIWIPFKNANTLGTHPLIGFETGCRYNKFNFNISLNIKFIDSANEYMIMLEDSVRKTDYFLGGYVGLDAEREIVRIKNHEIDFLIGIAYDGFSSVNTSTSDANPDNDKGKSINSLNINTGLGYRYNFKNHSYIGVRGKYNFVNYNNSGGTDLSGNTMTIVLVLGGFSNQKKYNSLNALNYKNQD